MMERMAPRAARAGGARVRLALAAMVAAVAIGGCTSDPVTVDASEQAGPDAAAPPTATSTVAPDTGHPPVAAPKPRALRADERRTTLRTPTAYTPSPPTGAGTDDYRCFLLDPNLPEDAWLTGTNIIPGNPEIVHHVILFRIDERLARAAEVQDATSPEPGWTCFGGMGLEGEFDNLDDASWLGAWAPGGRETLVQGGYGIPLASDTRIVMQVHYNLLAGRAPDRTATQLRWRPRAGADLQEIHTVLLPAPVELPCRRGRDAGPLCTHDASVEDAQARFGAGPAQVANLLHLLCGAEVIATETTSCTRTVQRPMTILGAAGHMHLLGRWLTIEANPGTPRAREVLHLPVWNFDDQAAQPVEPLHLDAGDTLRVTCHHEQWLRDVIPALQGAEEKYVVWGEGTTDEMCLGILQAVFDD